MSQFSWESVVAEEAQPQQQSAEPMADPGALALSVDDFSALENSLRIT